MTAIYPFQWDDIPQDELKLSMPEADRGYVR